MIDGLLLEFMVECELRCRRMVALPAAERCAAHHRRPVQERPRADARHALALWLVARRTCSPNAAEPAR